ncbi:tetrahydrobiopterin biosynthesis enzymes-like protein [Mycena pura]|uniref:dihydroneopterin aldolase n=1 Tax=Mycena pura TaxID=153505 RepID=A0AAD6YIG1_9AGAR|nr:tetrahydrobiopterin biosynthesis enzymes-like protein [Mycena pura]
MRLPRDTIIIHDLRVSGTVGPDRWGKTRPQPIVLSIHVEASLVAAGATDDVADSVHYGNLAKDVIKRIQDASFANLFELAEIVAHLALEMDKRVEAVGIDARALNQFLQADALGVEIRRSRTAAGSDSASDADADVSVIHNLRTTVIIGVNPPEREAKQTVLLNLRFHALDWLKATATQSWQDIHAILLKAIESTNFLTLEAFATAVAQAACQIDGVDGVTVRAQKPSALTTAHSSGVEITRNRAFFNLLPQ